MTISLTPSTDALLREAATRTGKDADTLANSLLADALTDAAREFDETVAGIQRGLDAAARGRERPIEEYIAEVRERRRLRGA